MIQQSVTDLSLGELVKHATADLSTLVRKEIELAKLEITQDVVAAGKGAGLFGGAGVSGLLALVFLSAGAAVGLGEVWGTWAGFLVVGGGYLILAAVLAVTGKKAISAVGPPEKTIETVKDDLSWAKHPTVVPGHREGEHLD